jgi:putative oxidoreductase
MNKPAALFNRLGRLCAKLPEDIILIAGRVAMFSVFWRSVQTKVTGWEVFGQSLQFFNISSSTVMLFQYEYQLPLLSPTAAAYAGTFAEFFFSLMLLFGLWTRLAAFGLLCVTAVIQFLVFPEAWPTHILWFAILLYLLKRGGGTFSLDYLLGSRI